MRRLFNLIILLALSVSVIYAGESFFGISDKSLGLLTVPNSAPGLGRSYEIAAMDSTQINYLNYSMWPSISLTSYSVKFSFNGSFSEDRFKQNYTNSVANYAGGFLTVPLIKHKLVFGVGLLPVSAMEQRYEEPAEADEASHEILIKGGLSKATMNLSFKVLPNFGIGLGYEYNFGKISKDYRYLDENADFSPLLIQEESRFSGHGTVLSAHFLPMKKLNLGLVYRPKISVELSSQFNTSATEIDQEKVKTITIPAQISLGTEYLLSDRLAIGLDYNFQNWKKEYKINDELLGSPFSEYIYLGMGIERRHSRKLFTSLKEKMDYRLGGFYRQLSQTSAENPVNEYGISFGFSLPLQRFRSKIDFSGLLGKRGNVTDNTYEETFYRIGISVSALETWFVKLKD